MAPAIRINVERLIGTLGQPPPQVADYMPQGRFEPAEGFYLDISKALGWSR
jgi:hypothetical protein